MTRRVMAYSVSASVLVILFNVYFALNPEVDGVRQKLAWAVIGVCALNIVAVVVAYRRAPRPS